MGANRHNIRNPVKDWPVSRRFGICNTIAANDQLYFDYLWLLCNYLHTKKHCQEGKEGHEKHLQSIAKLKAYLNKVQKDFTHA